MLIWTASLVGLQFTYGKRSVHVFFYVCELAGCYRTLTGRVIECDFIVATSVLLIEAGQSFEISEAV